MSIIHRLEDVMKISPVFKSIFSSDLPQFSQLQQQLPQEAVQEDNGEERLGDGESGN